MNLLRLLGLRPAEPAKAMDRKTPAPLLREEMLASLLVMAWVVEARDPYTGGHLWRVSRYAALLGERAGLDSASTARISLGGFLHDLGKVAIDDAILRKRAPLDPGEYEVIKTHPELGERMLAGHPLASLVREAVLLHHERPDGRGYPQGLAGAAVPLPARVVGVCDAFDAMTSSRPYRAGLPLAEVLQRIEAELGRQFDASLGRHLIEMGRAGLLDAIIGHSDDGIPLQHCALCGPTLVLRREQRAGEHIACPSCGGEHRLERDAAGALQARATGQQAAVSARLPQPDLALIQRFVRDSAHGLQHSLN